jgi:GNAT superfamily N-acetyltransferase
MTTIPLKVLPLREGVGFHNQLLHLTREDSRRFSLRLSRFHCFTARAGEQHVRNRKEYLMNDGHVISTDKDRLDTPVIHDFISNRSYWGKDRTIETVRKTIENSLCFGVYDKDNNLVGFARVVTDFTIFAYVMDVFILEEHRSRGLGKQLMEYILGYPDLQDILFWRLDTNDAHGLYSRYGFEKPAYPERIMEIRKKPANKAVQRIAETAGSR